ncbi:hypothetical protein WP12_21565 [Sphingomonas sp. SRS2]|nr:hypothetical protein WP12_21565 [Sphingomonas sp. SRS2]
MTIDTMLARDNASYTLVCSRLRPANLPLLSAVWASRFGLLNRIFTLQNGNVANTDRHPSVPLPDGFAIQGREVVFLDMLRAFVSPAPEFVIHELRVYDANIGEGDRFAELMLDAIETRVRYSPNFGIWRSVSGRVDRIYHLWGYRSLDERDLVRSQTREDAVWQAYTDTILPMLQSMNTMLLAPLVAIDG